MQQTPTPTAIQLFDFFNSLARCKLQKVNAYVSTLSSIKSFISYFSKVILASFPLGSRLGT